MSSKKIEARERVKAMREEQARKERQRERLLRFGIAGAVVAAVAIIAVAVTASGGDDDPAARPDTVTEDGGGVTFGAVDAPVTLDLWIDFLCPHCQEFEAQNGATLDDLVQAGDAKVVYHPVTFTGRNYSTRANNAFACAVDAGKGEDYFAALFESPRQWSNNDLVDLGESVGLEGDFEDCVRDDTYEDWSADVTTVAQGNADITGTPAVFVNGQVLDAASWNPDGIRAAVETAAAGGTIAPTDAPTGAATP